MLSINTNSGAMAAVQMYKSATNELSGVQKRISTGLKVADGFDDASTYAIAQGLRSDLKAFGKIGESLNSVRGAIEVGMAGADSVSNLVGSDPGKGNLAVGRQPERGSARHLHG